MNYPNFIYLFLILFILFNLINCMNKGKRPMKGEETTTTSNILPEELNNYFEINTTWEGKIFVSCKIPVNYEHSKRQMKEERCGITFDLDSEIVSQLKEHLKDYHSIDISNSNEENDSEEDQGSKKQSNKKPLIWQYYTIKIVNGEKIVYCNLNDKNGKKCEEWFFPVTAQITNKLKYHFVRDHIYGLKNANFDEVINKCFDIDHTKKLAFCNLCKKELQYKNTRNKKSLERHLTIHTTKELENYLSGKYNVGEGSNKI